MLPLFLLLLGACATHAQTTIKPAAKHAWGANIGWINAVGDVANGVAIRESFLHGYAWSGNCGWISFGSTPVNGHAYENTSANDFGVNQDGTGRLSGYAYGENIGWLNFGWASPTDPDRPRFDLLTGVFSGYAYSGNCGWINLGAGFLAAESIRRPDSDADGIADAWEMRLFGDLTSATATSDSDGDGYSDLAEYRADTLPHAGDHHPRTLLLPVSGGTSATLRFASESTRLYRITTSADLTTWTDSGLGVFSPDPGATTERTLTFPATSALFFRVLHHLPLTP